MKVILLILACTLIKHSYCQFTVDLGDDVVRCASLYSTGDEVYLGENAILSGGTSPYTYLWSCDTVFSLLGPRTVTDFLSDINILNPKLNTHAVENQAFYYKLTVEDSEGKIAVDSIAVKYGVMYVMLYEYGLNVRLGDSVQFFKKTVVNGGIQPVTYYWYPSDDLRDSSIVDTWCIPTKLLNKRYYQYFIDSEGCVSDTFPLYDVQVYPPVSINTTNEVDGSCYQIGNEIITDNLRGEVMQFYFVSTNGKLIFKNNTNKASFKIPDCIPKGEVVICVLLFADKKEVIKIKKN